MDYSKFRLDKDELIGKAVMLCYKEMYERAQPSADFEDLLYEFNKIKAETGKEERFFDRYYLSSEEQEYILDKYIKYFRLRDEFRDHVDILIDCIKNGYSVDKYIERKGEKPGYRSYAKAPNMKSVIGESNTDYVLKFLAERKNFYHFNQDEESFRFSISLGSSPCTSEKKVEEYWKSQGIDLKITPRHYNSDKFWAEENEYSDEDDQD